MFTQYIEFLQAIPLFQNLDENQFSSILPYFHVQKFKKDSLIIVDNSEKDFFYIIYEGQVEIFKEYEDFKEVLALKETGEFFGEMAFIDNFKRSASAKAKTDVTLISLDKSGFYKILSFPEVTISILKNITKDLRNQNNVYIKKLKKEIDSLKRSQLNTLLKEKENILYDTIIKYLYEMKNPITIINGLLELYNKNQPPHKKEEILKNIKHEIKILENIISDILFYSKDNYKYNFSEVDFNNFYLNLKDDINNYIRNLNLKTSFNTNDINIKKLYIDEKYIKKAIIHIIKYIISLSNSENVITINIDFKSIDRNLTIKISCSDFFIPLETKELIFNNKIIDTEIINLSNYFDSFDLSISSKIISDHKGTLKLTNENNRTIFHIYIPISN